MWPKYKEVIGMIIRILQVLTYIVGCIRLGVKPWLFFQLNAPYFNEVKGIYSKLDIDRLIPDRWRLQQFMDVGGREPSQYPVFVKPEWGQNSYGIECANNLQELNQIRQARGESKFNYLIQHAALEKIEFEIFMIADHTDLSRAAVLSITQVHNRCEDEFPINGIHNGDTYYVDISHKLTSEQTEKLWENLSKIGTFRIARFGLRANSIDDMVKGDFHIIEINLLFPMPLLLISQGRTFRKNWQFIKMAMNHLIKVTKTIPPQQAAKSIFMRNAWYNQKLKIKVQSESPE